MEEKEKTSQKIDIKDDKDLSAESESIEANDDAAAEVTSDADEDSGAEEVSPSKEEELTIKLKEAEEKIKELNDNYVRSHAELENFKKRTRKEVSDFKKYAVEAIVKQLLPVFDNLERAVFSAESSGESESCQITQGIKMTLGEIDRVFEQFNIKTVNAMGEKFDPAFHMAVGQEERDDVEDNIVINQFQKGYLLHDRLIRPSMVTVSKAKPKTENNNEDSKEPENNENINEETQE